MGVAPAVVVFATVHGLLDWPDATLVSDDAVEIIARQRRCLSFGFVRMAAFDDSGVDR